MPGKDIGSLRGRLPSSRPKKWKREPRICKQCGDEFHRIRVKQKYCSPECREAYWAGNKRWMPDPETATMAEIAEFLSGYLKAVKGLPDHGKIVLKW